MAFRPRLVVTGREADGTSIVVSDSAVDPVTIGAAPGLAFYLMWGTEDGIPTVGTTPRGPATSPFFAGPGGTRFLFARYEPESTTPEPVGDPEELRAEAARELPGLLEVDEPGHPGMHTTDTLDYAVCLAGELYLELDHGREVLLTPGSCVVQQGTRHAWHNRGEEPALMCFVGIGALREPDAE